MKIAVCLLMLSFATGSALAQVAPAHTIYVGGEAQLLLSPDYATIELGVVTQAKTVAAALEENSARMSRVVTAIKRLGVAEKDIRTSTFRIQPRYQSLPQGQYVESTFRTIEGYGVSNQVTVTVRDLTRIARVIDESASAGVNAAGSVSFGLDNVSGRLDEAKRKAVEDARHKAEILAEAAHITLGPVVAIRDNEAITINGRPSGDLETVVVTGSRVATPIEPGLVSVRSSLSVEFATDTGAAH